MVLGWWMQTIPKQPVGPRADAYNLHKSIGLAALLLMAVRLAWRASHRRRSCLHFHGGRRTPRRPSTCCCTPSCSSPRLAAISALTTSGYPVKFFGWVLPSWAGAHDAIKDACSVVHLVSNWVLVAAIGAHIAATIYHQWGLRDGLFWRMWPTGERRRGARARRKG